MTHGSLFTGIGGFDLVEIDKFCQKVLVKNFPKVKKYGDIKKFDGKKYRGAIDVLSGGFPCQPVSIAGKRKGDTDDRWLWPEMYRVIREIQPTYFVAENVPGLLTAKHGLLYQQIRFDLEVEGYETRLFIIPARALNAPHRRDRIWIIAYSNSFRCNNEQNENGGSQQCRISKSDSNTPNTDGKRLQRRNQQAKGRGKQSRQFGPRDWEQNWYEVATRLCRVDDGIPNRMDRIKALGNAIVPQIAYEIFKAIEKVNKIQYLNNA